MTDDERAEAVEQAKRDRVAQGLTPTIEDPWPYRLLANVIAKKKRDEARS